MGIIRNTTRKRRVRNLPNHGMNTCVREIDENVNTNSAKKTQVF
jgi:hypothetical protein